MFTSRIKLVYERRDRFVVQAWPLSVKYFFVVSLALISVGCATKQTFWERPGASSNDFHMDNAECNARALSAPVNMFGFALIKNQCLQGKGWYLVERDVSVASSPKPVMDLSNRELQSDLQRARGSYDSEVKGACSRLDMSVIMTLTSCFSNGISLEQMASTEKLHPRYRDSFLAWRSKVYSSTRTLADAEAKFGGASGGRVAAHMLGQFLADSEKNDLSLIDGDITWGSYNRRRKEITERLLQELRQ